MRPIATKKTAAEMSEPHHGDKHDLQMAISVPANTAGTCNEDCVLFCNLEVAETRTHKNEHDFKERTLNDLAKEPKKAQGTPQESSSTRKLDQLEHVDRVVEVQSTGLAQDSAGDNRHDQHVERRPLKPSDTKPKKEDTTRKLDYVMVPPGVSEKKTKLEHKGASKNPKDDSNRQDRAPDKPEGPRPGREEKLSLQDHPRGADRKDDLRIRRSKSPRELPSREGHKQCTSSGKKEGHRLKGEEIKEKKESCKHPQVRKSSDEMCMSSKSSKGLRDRKTSSEGSSKSRRTSSTSEEYTERKKALRNVDHGESDKERISKSSRDSTDRGVPEDKQKKRHSKYEDEIPSSKRGHTDGKKGDSKKDMSGKRVEKQKMGGNEKGDYTEDLSVARGDKEGLSSQVYEQRVQKCDSDIGGEQSAVKLNNDKVGNLKQSDSGDRCKEQKPSANEKTGSSVSVLKINESLLATQPVTGKVRRDSSEFIIVKAIDRKKEIRWPTSIIRYTSSKPFISYGCNPKYAHTNITAPKKDIIAQEPKKEVLEEKLEEVVVNAQNLKDMSGLQALQCLYENAESPEQDESEDVSHEEQESSKEVEREEMAAPPSVDDQTGNTFPPGSPNSDQETCTLMLPVRETPSKLEDVHSEITVYEECAAYEELQDDKLLIEATSEDCTVVTFETVGGTDGNESDSITVDPSKDSKSVPSKPVSSPPPELASSQQNSTESEFGDVPHAFPADSAATLNVLAPAAVTECPILAPAVHIQAPVTPPTLPATSVLVAPDPSSILMPIFSSTLPPQIDLNNMTDFAVGVLPCLPPELVPTVADPQQKDLHSEYERFMEQLNLGSCIEVEVCQEEEIPLEDAVTVEVSSDQLAGTVEDSNGVEVRVSKSEVENPDAITNDKIEEELLPPSPSLSKHSQKRKHKHSGHVQREVVEAAPSPPKKQALSAGLSSSPNINSTCALSKKGKAGPIIIKVQAENEHLDSTQQLGQEVPSFQCSASNVTEVPLEASSEKQEAPVNLVEMESSSDMFLTVFNTEDISLAAVEEVACSSSEEMPAPEVREESPPPPPPPPKSLLRKRNVTLVSEDDTPPPPPPPPPRPPPKLLILPPPPAGILIPAGRSSTSSDAKKTVTFADGIPPGRDPPTYSDAGHSSPPPPPPPPPRERRTRTKVHVQVATIPAASNDDDEPPPPPPPPKKPPLAVTIQPQSAETVAYQQFQVQMQPYSTAAYAVPYGTYPQGYTVNVPYPHAATYAYAAPPPPPPQQPQQHPQQQQQLYSAQPAAYQYHVMAAQPHQVMPPRPPT